MVKSIIDGRKMNENDFESAWQELVLKKMENMHVDPSNLENQYVSYNCGFCDGLKMALVLNKSKS